MASKVELICLNCSNLFTVHPYRKNSARFCSRTCQSQNRLGKKLSSEHKFKIRASLKNKPHPISKKREFIDKTFSCCDCGKEAQRTGTHEIRCVDCRSAYRKKLGQEWRKNNIKSLEDAIDCEELWDIKNNRTLCFDCHKKTETYLNPFAFLYDGSNKTKGVN